jgi:hypothetical protein
MAAAAQVPPLVAAYFGPDAAHPTIHAAFIPGRGWRRYPFDKRISVAWARQHLVPDGVTHIQLTDGTRYADFAVNELLSRRQVGSATPVSTAKCGNSSKSALYWLPTITDEYKQPRWVDCPCGKRVCVRGSGFTIAVHNRSPSAAAAQGN